MPHIDRPRLRFRRRPDTGLSIARPWIACSSLAALLIAAVATPPAAAGPADLGRARPRLAGPTAELLPAGAGYDPAVPPPDEVLGFELGARHVEPAEQVRYAERLVAASPRVALEIQGTTWEGRPQPLLVFTSPANHARLEELRRAHLAAAGAGGPAPAGDAGAADPPVVVWLGYSIHGNEASGANASLAVAWWLAASQAPEVDALLDRAVVLIDPSLNPDGLARFSAWVNANASAAAVADPASREHREPWPGGRTNHYWFDLNRDWLLLQQPESRHRMATWRRWRPNLLGDFHEMGSDATYFFQPGVESRQNPGIPAANRRLTERIAAYHAAALDAAGSLYYSEETYDDFYPGKGSTYPDLTGGIGILFEQASARGRLMATPRGELGLRRAIANHVATSLAMLTAARELHDELVSYQAGFFREVAAEAGRDPVRGWAFSTPGDPERGRRMVELLAGHGIAVHRPRAAFTAGGIDFDPASCWVVPTAQPGYRLIKALFERPISFADSAFYDISAWTLPFAFGAAGASLDERELAAAGVGPGSVAAGGAAPAAAEPGAGTASAPPYAWVLDWRALEAPAALAALLDDGAAAAVATRPLVVATAGGRLELDAGAVVVSPSPGLDAAALAERVGAATAGRAVPAHPVAGGLTAEGIDLGSPRLRPLVRPEPALVVGDGVDGNEAGEVWHLLDRRVGIPLSQVDRDRLGELDLGRYTHLLMVDGDYDALAEETAAALRRWVRAGGVLVASQRAAVWAGTELLRAAPEGRDETAEEPEKDAAGAMKERPEPPPPPPPPARAAYAEFDRDRQAMRITGAIFEVDLDRTHPLAFGYPSRRLPVFVDSTRVLEPRDNPYENAAVFTAEPLLAGYAPDDGRRRLAGSAAVTATRLGRGTVVRFAFDPSFRAYFRGTEKLYLNALFFGAAVEPTELPRR